MGGASLVSCSVAVESVLVCTNSLQRERESCLGNIMPRARRFVPPLKEPWSGAPSANSSFQESQSQWQQQEQVHTVLSYCEEIHEEGGLNKQNVDDSLCSSRELKSSFDEGDDIDILNTSDNSLDGCAEQPTSLVAMAPVRNFRTTKQRSFHFSILPKTLEKSRRSILKSSRRTAGAKAAVAARRKKVAITAPVDVHRSSKQQALEVFDYQATPQPPASEGGGECSHCEREPARSREEQLEIDREVLHTIKLIREDLRVIRKKHERWRLNRLGGGKGE